MVDRVEFYPKRLEAFTTVQLVTRPKILPFLSSSAFATSPTQDATAITNANNDRGITRLQGSLPVPGSFSLVVIPISFKRESIRWENGRGELLVGAGAVAANQRNRRAPQAELV